MASKDDKKPSTSRSRVGGIHTLADLNNTGDRPSSSDSDPDNTPQEYYTGGHKSGMLVQDPTKRNNISVADIFNRAREIGASTHTDAAAADSPQQQQPQVITHNIVFWTNGFTVDNGPLRRLDDPDNASFLESIKISECPKELEPADRRTPVNVNLIKKDQNYPEPEKSRVSFQGQGRTLGNAPPAPDVSAPPTSLNTAPPPRVGLAVARDLPSTSIQLRLADGTRMIAHFNVHHTVRDIRAFIDASRPGGSRNYNLQTVGFPPKQLTDPNQTIGEADLANSVIIQKL